MTDDVFEHFKPIRNKIRAFAPGDIIRRAVEILHERVDQRPAYKWDYQPWILFLLVRWTFQYADFRTPGTPCSHADFDNLYRSLYDLDTGITLSGEIDRDTIAAFMARTLFAQLPFQARTYELRSIGRQLIMFEGFGAAFNLDALFFERYGLSIRDFLRLYYSCWAGKGDRFSVRYFNGLFPDETIEAFFNSISVDLTSGAEFVRGYTQAGATIAFQYHEHTPLELRPMLKAGQQWSPFSFRLMETALQNNIYDFLKRDIPEFSAQIFGPVFEQYLEGTVKYYSEGKHDTEVSLKKRLPKGSKVVDFLIEDADAGIFIEAKATELNIRARVYQDKATILRNIRSTVLKAVVQSQSTACQMVRSGALKGKPLFALIVTFKDYLFGEGGLFWDDVIGEVVQAEIEEAGFEVTIPPSNIFYVPVGDFDWLMAGAKQRGLTVASVLTEVVERNKDADRRAIMLHQHLEKMWGEHYEPPALEQAREAFQQEMIDRFKPPASEQPAVTYPKTDLKNALRFRISRNALVGSWPPGTN